MFIRVEATCDFSLSPYIVRLLGTHWVSRSHMQSMIYPQDLQHFCAMWVLLGTGEQWLGRTETWQTDRPMGHHTPQSISLGQAAEKLYPLRMIRSS